MIKRQMACKILQKNLRHLPICKDSHDVLLDAKRRLPDRRAFLTLLSLLLLGRALERSTHTPDATSTTAGVLHHLFTLKAACGFPNQALLSVLGGSQSKWISQRSIKLATAVCHVLQEQGLDARIAVYEELVNLWNCCLCKRAFDSECPSGAAFHPQLWKTMCNPARSCR